MLIANAGLLQVLADRQQNPMWQWILDAEKTRLQQEARTYNFISRMRQGEIGYRSLMGSGFAPRGRSVSDDALASDLPAAQASGSTIQPDALGPATSRRPSWLFSTL